MIYILEGCDGSGKSTLAKYLSIKTGYPIKHRDKPKTQTEKNAMMADYLQDAKFGFSAIWDRSFYSEMIYGPLIRDKSYITQQQMTELEEALVVNGAIVFYCTGDLFDMWDRCASRGETYIKSIDMLSAIKNAYENLMFNKHHKIPIVKYEVGYGTIPAL